MYDVQLMSMHSFKQHAADIVTENDKTGAARRKYKASSTRKNDLLAIQGVPKSTHYIL